MNEALLCVFLAGFCISMGLVQLAQGWWRAHH